MSPYVGVSKSYLSNFNSENTQNGIGAPESALQYEVGIKFAFLQDHLVFNTSAFDILRDNVATAVTLNGVETVVFDSQRTKGVALALDAKQLNDQWHVLANVTYQDAYVTDNPAADFVGRQSPPGRSRAVPRQSLDELSLLDRGTVRLPHRRRTELSGEKLQRHHERELDPALSRRERRLRLRRKELRSRRQRAQHHQ